MKYQQQNYLIYFVAILTSLLFSFLCAQHEAIINPDAICYLASAEKFGTDGLHAAMSLCGQARWPLYAILIHYVTQISAFSYTSAAYFLDAIFSAISVLSFILIVKNIRASKRILIFAAITILCAHKFNSVRDYIIRDHGFWAFYLCAILAFITYLQKPKIIYALFFNISLLIASLFRVEGVIFLLTLPLFIWLYQPFTLRAKFRGFVLLNSCTCLAAIALGGFFVSHPHDAWNYLGRLAEFKLQLQQGYAYIIDNYQHAKTGLLNYVLNVDSAKHADLVLILVLITWFATSIITNLSWIYALLIFYAFYKKILPQARAVTLIIYGGLCINVGITFIFLLERNFLSKRYLIALILLLLLYIPLVLDYLYAKFSITKYRLTFVAVMLAIGIQAIGGIISFGYSKMYIADAGAWLAHNVPKNATLYSNDYQLMYYSQHFGDEIFVKMPQYAAEFTATPKELAYEFYALRLYNKFNNKNLVQQLEQQFGPPIKVFANKRGDSVKIYGKLSRSS